MGKQGAKMDQSGKLASYIDAPDETMQPRLRADKEKQEETRRIAEIHDLSQRVFVYKDLCKKTVPERRDE
jgi:hypothetical protein